MKKIPVFPGVGKIKSLPGTARSKRVDLTQGQLRVLKVLHESGGALTRSRISERTGTTAVFVSKQVGRSDPTKRAEFEQTADGGNRLSLLSLGYVIETELDVEGVKELCIQITPEGSKQYSLIAKGLGELPPPKGSEAIGGPAVAPTQAPVSFD